MELQEHIRFTQEEKIYFEENFEPFHLKKGHYLITKDELVEHFYYLENKYFVGAPILYGVSGIQRNCGMRVGITFLVYVHADVKVKMTCLMTLMYVPE